MLYISILLASHPYATHFGQYTWSAWELCFLAVSWMASHHWAARRKPTAPWGSTRLLTAGGRSTWIWYGSDTHTELGSPLPTCSRMILAGYKSGCSTLPVWAGFSQNEYLWCFHISDKPLESHNVVWIQMRLMATAQCPTTKTNSCKSDPVHGGLKLSQCSLERAFDHCQSRVLMGPLWKCRLGSKASGRWSHS